MLSAALFCHRSGPQCTAEATSVLGHLLNGEVGDESAALGDGDYGTGLDQLISPALDQQPAAFGGRSPRPRIEVPHHG